MAGPELICVDPDAPIFRIVVLVLTIIVMAIVVSSAVYFGRIKDAIDSRVINGKSVAKWSISRTSAYALEVLNWILFVLTAIIFIWAVIGIALHPTRRALIVKQLKEAKLGFGEVKEEVQPSQAQPKAQLVQVQPKPVQVQVQPVQLTQAQQYAQQVGQYAQLAQELAQTKAQLAQMTKPALAAIKPQALVQTGFPQPVISPIQTVLPQQTVISAIPQPTAPSFTPEQLAYLAQQNLPGIPNPFSLSAYQQPQGL